MNDQPYLRTTNEWWVYLTKFKSLNFKHLKKVEKKFFHFFKKYTLLTNRKFLKKKT